MRGACAGGPTMGGGGAVAVAVLGACGGWGLEMGARGWGWRAVAWKGWGGDWLEMWRWGWGGRGWE